MTGSERHFLRHRPDGWRLLAVAEVVFGVLPFPALPWAAAEEAGSESVLELKVDSLKVDKADMEHALRLLRDKDPSRILIGFEKVPHKDGPAENNISLQVAGATVGEILKLLCRADPRYRYVVVKGSIINLFPGKAASDPYRLMDLKIQSFDFDGPAFPHFLIEKINDYAPELREFLWTKAQEWAARSGKSVGYPGVISTGNMPPPKITIRLRNVTVRNALNALSLYSLTMFRQGELLGWSPTGWKYEFVIDPKAATGLGGYPRWSTF